MPKSPEHYEPTPEDYQKAEEMMTHDEKNLTTARVGKFNIEKEFEKDTQENFARMAKDYAEKETDDLLNLRKKILAQIEFEKKMMSVPSESRWRDDLVQESAGKVMYNEQLIDLIDKELAGRPEKKPKKNNRKNPR